MSNDRRLPWDAPAELSRGPRVTPAHIGVMSASGVVTLAGQVGSCAEERATEAAVSRVNAVQTEERP